MRRPAGIAQRHLNGLGLCLLLSAACCMGCTSRIAPNARATSAARAFRSPPIDSLFIYVRRSPTEDAHFSLWRKAGETRARLERPGGDGRPLKVLESLGPSRKDAAEVVTLLESFDVWALNAPDAPGASCRTVQGRRSCVIAHNDYSVVMLVASGRQVRVQRYIGLDQRTGSESARALGDYVLAWARKREGGGQRP